VRRIFTFVLGALAMLAVALVSAFITMRFAIHGREAVVPALVGLSAADAGRAAGHVGLNLTVENRFYSAEVPAGRILAQDPPPGSRVRREWAVRVTQSLGPQRVSVPDLAGESERAATVSVRRLSLDLGVVARLAVPGDADIVLAQTPDANSGGADSPRVSLLVSDPASVQPQAWVMPQLVGLTYADAADRAAMAGLHLEAASSPVPAAAATVVPGANATPASTALKAAQPAPGGPSPQPSLPPASAPPPPIIVRSSSIVTAQTPPPGFRVQQGDAVHIALADAASAFPPPQAAPQPASAAQASPGPRN